MRRGSKENRWLRARQETRRYTDAHIRRRRSRRLGLGAILLILLALGAALFKYGNLLSPEAAEQRQPEKQSQPEPTSTIKPDHGGDEAWATANAQDASPGLETSDETLGFGHRIALTFDDGPDPAATPAILDVLREHNVKATFFVIGARAEQHPELIQRIASEGHTLGNHTYYHKDMTRLTSDLELKELQDTQAAIDRALGGHSRITLFRPPCGAPYITETDKLPMIQRLMQEQRMYPVMWNIDPRDWALKGQPDGIVGSAVQSTPEDGGVVLLHDTQPQTADALPGILDYYTSANFEFTSVRNLLAEKYGVSADGIQASAKVQQPGATPQPGVPGDVSSLADCLT